MFLIDIDLRISMVYLLVLIRELENLLAILLIWEFKSFLMDLVYDELMILLLSWLRKEEVLYCGLILRNENMIVMCYVYVCD